MNNIKCALIFVAGVVLGSASATLIVKNKYETLAQNEIEDIRNYYKDKIKEPDKKEEIQAESVDKEEKTDDDSYKDIINNYKGDIVGEKPFIQKDDQIIDPYDLPYIISCEEYGEEETYDTMTLTYFADGVLVDDVDDLVDNPDYVVGLENLKVFEEFDGCSSIYVRNDLWKMDFEIIKDDWNWSDLQETEEKLLENIQTFKKPHQL